MRKTLLAAALAVGFAGAAQAQSTVTLYGVVDGGLGYTRFKDKNSGTLASKATKFGGEHGVRQGNRWGVRGVEDLGGGLKAEYRLESGFNLFQGTSEQGGRLFGRYATLALVSESWGKLQFGRDLNMADRFVPSVALPQGDSFKQAAAAKTFTSTSVRVDNLLSWQTPVFAGFEAAIGYSFHQNGGQPWDVGGTTDGDETLLTLAARYRNGPLTVAASYDQFDGATGNPNATAPDVPTPYVRDDKDIKAWILAATYDFGVVKLHLGFGQDKNGTMASRSDHNSALPRALRRQSAFTYYDGYKTHNYSVGLSVPVNDGALLGLGWHSARLGSGAYKNSVLTEKTSQSLYTAIYRHPLSKRTEAYAMGVYGTGYGFSNTTVTQAIVGLRHGF